MNKKEFVNLVYEYGAVGHKAFEDMTINEEQKEIVALAWATFSEDDDAEETDARFASYFTEYATAA